ncbi:MAG: 50S ribosomal protein L1 [Planctomycetota bacterium]
MVLASKRFRKAAEKVDRTKVYPVRDGVNLLKSIPPVKFDETVDVAIHLGIDPKKSDQLVRGAVSLPKGLGKSVKVAVFAEGARAEEAKAVGADFVGSEDLAKKINDGWTDFDVVIASPDMMKHVGKLGKVLGPQGKMPSPKSGTVTPDVAQAVREFKAGKVEFRTDAGGTVHAPVGKRSFQPEDLESNINSFVDHIRHMRPPSAKGIFIRKIVISSTMGPGIALEFHA